MADSYIDMSFGTAVMKCTPAHDPNDFALAKISFSDAKMYE